MGHSVGEYGALVAAGALSFERCDRGGERAGREMAHLNVDDPGAMAAAIAPLEEVEELVDGDRRLRRAGEHQLDAPGRDRRRHRSGRSRRSPSSSDAGTPRSRCRSATPSTPRSSRPSACRCARCSSGSACATPQLPVVANVDGELYPTGRGRRRADARDALAPGCLAGAVRQGPADAVRRGRARVRRGRSEACAAGLRVGRARRRHA